MLATVTVPVKLTEALGEKVKSRVTAWPGARVSPGETPLAEYDESETPALDIVTVEFPVLVNVTLSTFSLPTETFPKLKLEALGMRSAVAAIPVPLTVMVLGDVEASLKTVTTPETLPGVFGENTIVKLARSPAAMRSGSETPVRENPFAVVLACVTVRVDPPLFVTLTD